MAMIVGFCIGAYGFDRSHAQSTGPVFMIEDNTVVEPVGFAAEFAPLARDSVTAHGGQYLAGGSGVSVDGDPPKGRVVLIRWETMDQLMKWRCSPEYAKARTVGDKYGRFRIMAVEGAPQR